MLTVILLAVASQSLRNILLEAYDLGMNSGEYAFLAIELIKDSSTSSASHGWYKIGDRRNKEAREMFESLLQISSRVPTSIRFTSFVHEVTKRAHNEFAATLKDTDVSYIYFVDYFFYHSSYSSFATSFLVHLFVHFYFYLSFSLLIDIYVCTTILIYSSCPMKRAYSLHAIHRSMRFICRPPVSFHQTNILMRLFFM